MFLSSSRQFLGNLLKTYVNSKNFEPKFRHFDFEQFACFLKKSTPKLTKTTFSCIFFYTQTQKSINQTLNLISNNSASTLALKKSIIFNFRAMPSFFLRKSAFSPWVQTLRCVRWAGRGVLDLAGGCRVFGCCSTHTSPAQKVPGPRNGHFQGNLAQSAGTRTQN